MNTRRSFLTSLPLLAVGQLAAAEAPATPPAFFKTTGEIKRWFPFAEWKEATFRGLKLLVCMSMPPQMSESRIDFLGWVYNDRLEVWHSFFEASTRGVGRAD